MINPELCAKLAFAGEQDFKIKQDDQNRKLLKLFNESDEVGED